MPSAPWGQGTRRALLAAGPGGLPAGAVAARLGVPPSTLSFHLRALDRAGLIAATRRGRSLACAAQVHRLRGLLRFLAEACCGGGPARRVDDALPPPPAFDVPFLCTRDAARSIMGEAIPGGTGGDRFAAHSAGSDPAPDGPLPEVLARLEAIGHDVSRLRSKPRTAFTGPGAPRMDVVVALCDAPAGRVCPDLGDTTIAAAWPLPDPARFAGSAAERATLPDELHAGPRRRIEILTSLPFAALDRMALKARIDGLADPHAAAR